MRVHLDTDLGGDIDDLCALALLLRVPGVEITGITTTAEANGTRAGCVSQHNPLACAIAPGRGGRSARCTTSSARTSRTTE